MLKSGLGLREAHVGEAPAIAAVINAATANEGGGGWTYESALFEGKRTDADEIRDLFAAPGAKFLVRTRAGAIVACAYLKPMPDAAAAYLGMLSVRPEMQGLGIASDLLAECERIARDEWRRSLMLITVITTHRPELAAFYVRRGYRRTGRFKPGFDRRQVLLVEGLRPEWMEKLLAAPRIETTFQSE